jgi:hypothetical protein
MRDQGPIEDETPDAVDRVLRALAEQSLDDSLPAPADERLRAYREGLLDAAETRQLESLLARSAAGRRRLLELAGVDRSLPLRRVRKAVLAQAAPRPRRRAAWGTAAALAASILLAFLLLLPRHQGLPAGLAYDVAARGLAEVRSIDSEPGAVRAYPATTLRLLVRPRGDSPAGLSFALFRRAGDGLLRVRQPGEVRLTVERGSATFAGPAASVLATRAPGAHPLYVVVSSAGDLPSRLELEPGEDPAGALRASGRLVYSVMVTLLPDEPAAENGAR